MKKLFFRIFIFIVPFVIIDQAVGTVLSSLTAKAKSGDNWRNNYILRDMKADVVLLGSSRCIHHYNPNIIEDSLHMSCYNAGHGANGILMMYPYYKVISKRYHPKLIIYDVNSFDLDKDDYTKYLEWLKPYYGKPNVDSMIWAINPDEKLKLFCRSYQYNGKVFSTIANYLHSSNGLIIIKGYEPMNGTVSYPPKNNEQNNIIQDSIDSFKKSYLIRLIKDCKQSGTKIVFMVSPTYGQTKHSKYYSAMSNLCKQYKVPFFYNEINRRFSLNRNYFVDGVHLNSKGADEYTKMIVSEIKTISEYSNIVR